MTSLTTTTFTTRDGLALVADVDGPTDGPLVMLLHGGGQTRHSWRRTRDGLIRSGFRCVALDARGHGDSAWSPDGAYDIDAFAGDIMDVAAALGRPAVFVGASMGGISALLALDSPTPPPSKALVLVDVTPRINMEGASRIGSFMTASPDGFATLDDVADAVAAYNPNRPRPANAKGLLKNLREVNGRFYWHWDPVFLSSERRLDPRVYERRLEEAARNLSVPTLLVRGANSDIVGVEEFEAFLRLTPHAEFVDILGAGHMAAGDDNDAFSDAIFDFVARAHGAARI